MSEYLDTIKVNTAIDSGSKFDLGFQHITTANFMQLNPVLCKEMVPGERVKGSMMTFSRLAPLAVPTFGRANIKERAFFVPMRTIFKGWNDFITDTVHINSSLVTWEADPAGISGIQNTVPIMQNYQLVESFLAGGIVYPTIGGDATIKYFLNSVSSSDPYDVCIVDLQGRPSYYTFTSYGRQWLKVLESLGYKIVWDARNNDIYSALPLLALCKIYIDWYYPSAYAQTGDYAKVAAIMNSDVTNPYIITAVDLCYIAKLLLYVNYDSDYFVSAWDNPVAPSNGVYSNFNITDITVNGHGLYQSGNVGFANANGEYFGPAAGGSQTIVGFGVRNDSNTYGTPTTAMDMSISSTNYRRIGMSVSDYQHTALKKLTDYMKRHQLVGARAMDRYLARYGKALTPEKMNRCNYIGSKLVPLQIGDVFSTSNTNANTHNVSNLGDYAGKGMAYEKSFDFEWYTDEFGYIVVLSSIVPASGIYQGLDRKVMHTSRLDFWTPEFDALGVQAVSTRELYNEYDSYSYTGMSDASNGYQSFSSAVFGFAPRYGEYKYSKDQLTGDFVVKTLNANAASPSFDNSWHMFRTFDPEYFYDGSYYNFNNFTHSMEFVSGLSDHYQFDRIFMYHPKNEADMPDPFNVIYDFDLVSFAPMKSLYETYEFEDKGKQVTEEANGVKMN